MAKETYIGGTNDKSKHIPDLGYIGIPVSGVGKSKRILKGYIGNAQNKAKLFWEYGGDIDKRFVAQWQYDYTIGTSYTLRLEDVEKMIKYPLIRGLWLSENNDGVTYEHFKKCYKYLKTVITRAKEIMAQNNYNIIRVNLSTDSPERIDRTGFVISFGAIENQSYKMNDFSQLPGSLTLGNYLRQQDGTYRVINYYKLLYANFYSSGVTLYEQDYSSYTDAAVYCGTSGSNPYNFGGTNLGIVFVEQEGTDLVDIINFQGKTKFDDKYIKNEYSLNSATTPSSLSYNNVVVDANGATMSNDISFITIPSWWVFEGLFCIELDLGYIPSSVATTSDYIFLLAFTYTIGIAYNKSQGVWGVWDYENNAGIFRASKISALDYFANKKVQIIFDKQGQTVSVLRGNTLAFTLPFKYRNFDMISPNDLYIGGPRTVSNYNANCIAGMVTKCIRVYKNVKTGLKFQYPDPQAGVTYTFNYCDLAAFLMYMMREFARIYGPVGNYQNFQQMFEHEAQIINYFTTNNTSNSKVVGVMIYAYAGGYYSYGVQQDRICIEVFYPYGQGITSINRQVNLPANQVVAPLPSSGSITDTYDTGLINYRFSSSVSFVGYNHKQINIYPNGDYYEDAETSNPQGSHTINGVGFTNGYVRSYHRYQWYGYDLRMYGANVGLVV